MLEIIHRIPTNEHLRPHTKNILSVMFRFLEVDMCSSKRIILHWIRVFCCSFGEGCWLLLFQLLIFFPLFDRLKVRKMC